MSRSYDELFRAACGIRYKAIHDGKDPKHGVFYVTHQELDELLKRAPCHVEQKQWRFYGLRLLTV